MGERTVWRLAASSPSMKKAYSCREVLSSRPRLPVTGCIRTGSIMFVCTWHSVLQLVTTIRKRRTVSMNGFNIKEIYRKSFIGAAWRRGAPARPYSRNHSNTKEIYTVRKITHRAGVERRGSGQALLQERLQHQKAWPQVTPASLP